MWVWKVNFIKLFGNSCLSLIFLTCCVPANACGEDQEWWKPPEKISFRLNDFLPNSQFAEVTRPFRPVAIKELQHLEFRRISRDNANRYTDEAFAKAAPVNYYLIRAVRLIDGGNFAAYLRRSSVYIVHNDLGVDRMSVQSAVVVAVKSRITEAFAACEIAE